MKAIHNQIFSDLFFEGASIGLNLCAIDGTWLLSNPAFLKIIGYSREEADGGLTYWQLTPRKYDPQEKVQLERLFSEGRYGPYEKEFIRKDGTLVPVRLNGFLVENQGKKYIWSMIEDLSEIRKLEDLVRGQVDFTHAILANLPVAVFAKDVRNNFRFTMWNKAAERIFGLREEQVINKNDFDLFPKDQADFFRRMDLKTISQGSAVEINEEIGRRGDEDIWLRTTKLCLTNSEGIPETLFGITQDVTKERLENQTQKNMTALLDALPDYIVHFDLRGRPRYINPAARKELGWTLDSMNQAKVSAHDFSAKLDREVFTDIISTGKIWEGELEVQNWITNEPVPTWVKAFAFKDDRDVPLGFAIISRDIRARKIAEAAIAHSSRMASLGEMAGGIAHEINNPLAIIVSKAEQVKRRVVTQPMNVESILGDLDKIEKTGYRISKIIRGLKSFSRNAENDPLLESDFANLVEEALELCRERFKTLKIHLRLHLDADLFIECRPSQIAQVILNLLNNSIDALTGCEDGWVELSAHHQGKLLKISITDSGDGIPESIADRVMQPFFTTKDIGKGTGLGLSISKGIVEAHGGQIYLDRSCKNTRFIIELPIAQEKSGTTSKAA